MSQHFPYREYKVVTTVPNRQWTCRLVDAVIDGSLEPQHVFKSNPRTYSALLRLDDQSIMLKVPRSRNKRKWERFLTLFRPSEGIRTFNNLAKMEQLGLIAPPPLLAAEKRHCGVVTDSFACYVFEEGRPAGPNDAEEVMSSLLQLHSLGYLRTDPQPANFLISERGVVFIDFRLKKARFPSRLNKNRELAKLARIYPECVPFIPTTITQTVGFRVAKFFEYTMANAKTLKRVLRQRLIGSR